MPWRPTLSEYAGPTPMPVVPSFLRPRSRSSRRSSAMCHGMMRWARALPRDQRSELRELNQREAARWLTGPPEARVPVRIIRGMIAEAERGSPELALEQHRRPALVVRARHEDRGTQMAVLHELRDALRVLLRGRRGAFHDDRGRGDTGRDGGSLHELGRGHRFGVA